MVVGSNPVAVTSPSDFAPASSKEFLDIQATIECGFTLKRVRDMIKTYSQKILIVFDDMIADMNTNKKFQSIVIELFIRYRKLNISLVFITPTYFPVRKDIRLNSTHYLIMKIHNKKELRSIAVNHSADIDYNNFMNSYRKHK